MYIHIRICVCTCIYIYIHMYVQMYVCLYVYSIHICLYMYMPRDIFAYRCGLEQKHNVRLIDDRRPINKCSCLQEKLKIQAFDRFCAIMARAFQLHAREAPHDVFFQKLMGRCLDLKSAYNQFGIRARTAIGFARLQVILLTEA